MVARGAGGDAGDGRAREARPQGEGTVAPEAEAAAVARAWLFWLRFPGGERSSGSGDGCASLSAAELSQVSVPMGSTDPVAAVGGGGGTLRQTCSSRLTSWIAAFDARATRLRDATTPSGTAFFATPHGCFVNFLRVCVCVFFKKKRYTCVHLGLARLGMRTSCTTARNVLLLLLLLHRKASSVPVNGF